MQIAVVFVRHGMQTTEIGQYAQPKHYYKAYNYDYDA